jgi:hypothetical protein
MTIPRANRVTYSFVNVQSGIYLNIDSVAMIPFTGWSVAIESFYLAGCQDAQSLAISGAIVFSSNTPDLIVPNTVDQFGNFTNVIGQIPLNFDTLTYPPTYNDGNGGGVWYQNPCPYESRTKVILNTVVGSYQINLNYLFNNGGSVSPDATNIAFTLIFYDDTDGSSFTPNNIPG